MPGLLLRQRVCQIQDSSTHDVFVWKRHPGYCCQPQVEAQLLAVDAQFLRLHGVPAGRALDLYGRTMGAGPAASGDERAAPRRAALALPPSASTLRWGPGRTAVQMSGSSGCQARKMHVGVGAAVHGLALQHSNVTRQQLLMAGAAGCGRWWTVALDPRQRARLRPSARRDSRPGRLGWRR